MCDRSNQYSVVVSAVRKDAADKSVARGHGENVLASGCRLSLVVKNPENDPFGVLKSFIRDIASHAPTRQSVQSTHVTE
jgi:hypothetical protein